MGGETPPQELVKVLDRYLGQAAPKTLFRLYLSEKFRGIPLLSPNLIPVFCQEENTPTESLLTLLKLRKDSSLSRGLQELATGEITHFLTTASTPHLTALAQHIVGLVPGIRRPALISKIPSFKGSFLLLDVGCSLSQSISRYSELLEIALNHWQTSSPPRIALLNIGSEDKKGSPKLRKIFDFLKKKEGSSYTFLGNREPTFVFESEIDILLTDGFSGNLFIKSIEGSCRFLLKNILQQAPEWGAKVNKWSQALRKGKHLGVLAGCKKKIYKTHNYVSAEEFCSAALELT